MNARKSVLSKVLKIGGIFAAILFCVVAVQFFSMRPKQLKISSVDFTTIEDGVYVGNADNGVVKVSVSVEMSGGEIQNIKILEHDNMLGKPAEKITDKVIEQQSLEVDAITSATYSSNTILKAIENALRQGE